jgi:lipopolysaccharide transport system ATP-binding protein
MSSELAISVNNVSKAYTIWRDPAARLKHPLLNLAGELFPPLRKKIDTKLHGLCSEFYALRDISFDVKKGESVGIIGRNGSGKSTLLQIIAGTLQPTQGSVTVHGRVAALLELGSGFNPEFTGRENVYLNASILGLTREETDARFTKIEAFADIGDFINQPVKTYSSGMVVRLAFAVQSMVDPDILIIDEALNVGDYFFQQKCARRMRELREVGTTLLFVSHDMASVRDLCQKALYLKEGQSVFWGASEKAIGFYFNETTSVATKPSAKGSAPHENLQAPISLPSQSYLDRLRNEAVWWNKETPHDQEAYILGVGTYDEEEKPSEKITMSKKVKIKILLVSLIQQNYYLSVTFKNRYDQIINGTISYLDGDQYIEMKPNEIAEIEFCFDLNIEAGQYSYQIVLAQQNQFCNKGVRLHETYWLGPLEVSWDYENQMAPFLGMFGIPVKVAKKQSVIS